MKGSESLNENEPELGERTDDVGGGGQHRLMIDLRWLNIIRLLFSSCPGITQRMVRCGQLMICPSVPFTFCIRLFTYYGDPPLSAGSQHRWLGSLSDWRALFIGAFTHKFYHRMLIRCFHVSREAQEKKVTRQTMAFLVSTLPPQPHFKAHV